MNTTRQKLEEIRQAKDHFSNKLEWPEDVTHAKCVLFRILTQDNRRERPTAREV